LPLLAEASERSRYAGECIPPVVVAYADRHEKLTLWIEADDSD
jgi:hypothetical protein